MEYWNGGMAVVRRISIYKIFFTSLSKWILSTTHYSIIPVFQYSNILIMNEAN